MVNGGLFFAPVGAWGQTVKISPPLTIPREALEEGLAVLGEATDEAVAALDAGASADAGVRRKPDLVSA